MGSAKKGVSIIPARTRLILDVFKTPYELVKQEVTSVNANKLQVTEVFLEDCQVVQLDKLHYGIYNINYENCINL